MVTIAPVMASIAEQKNALYRPDTPPPAVRPARSYVATAEAFLSLGAVSYLFVAFTRVLLRPDERITNAHARAEKTGFADARFQ